MRICILATSYPRTRKDYWVPFMHSWARELAKTEDITVVSSGDSTTKDFEIRDNVKIYRFYYFFPKSMQKLTYTGGMRESFKHSFLAKLQVPFFLASFFLKSIRPCIKSDIINAHWTLSGLVALPFKIIFKKPIVLTEHGGSIRGLPKWLNKFVFKRMDIITTAHQDLIDEMKKIGIKNIIDIKNFLDEDKFLKKYDTKKIKQELKIKNQKVVTFIGRFEELKDPLTFIRSIPFAIKKEKNIQFIMIGDGHYKEDILKEIKKLGIEKYIFMPGPTREVEKFYAISDIFVACSATENCFSTTILEAMLAKIPCIITRAGLTEKFFVHKENSYLIDKKNPKQLGNGISDLLKSSALRKKISSNGINFLEKYGFRNKIITQKIINTFKDTIKKADKKNDIQRT